MDGVHLFEYLLRRLGQILLCTAQQHDEACQPIWFPVLTPQSPDGQHAPYPSFSWKSMIILIKIILQKKKKKLDQAESLEGQ